MNIAIQGKSKPRFERVLQPGCASCDREGLRRFSQEPASREPPRLLWLAIKLENVVGIYFSCHKFVHRVFPPFLVVHEAAALWGWIE